MCFAAGGIMSAGSSCLSLQDGNGDDRNGQRRNRVFGRTQAACSGAAGGNNSRT